MGALLIYVRIVKCKAVNVDGGGFQVDRSGFGQLCGGAKVLNDYSIFLLFFIAFRRPRGLTALAPAKPGHARPGAVHSAAGDADKVGQLLTGLPELHGAGGGVGPGGILGQIAALVLAHGALPGPLHLADLVPGVLAAVVLDVPGVEGFQALLRPCRRCTQLREDGKEGVTAVPAAKPGPGAVAGGGLEVRVMSAHVVYSAAPVELPALPLGV